MVSKKMITVCLFVIATFLVSCSGPKKQQAVAPEDNIDYSKLVTKGPKKRLALGEFINKAQYSKGRIGNEASDVLSTHLTKSGAFIMIEREQMSKIMGEQALGQTGAVKGETAAKVGELLGAQAMIVGSVTDVGYNTSTQDGGVFKKKVQSARIVVNIRAIDTTTGAIIFAESGEGIAETENSQVMGFGSSSGYDETLLGRALNASIVKLVSNLIKNLDKMQWAGRVVKMSDSGKVIVNAGQATGLQVGDVLSVNALGEMLTDPETGMQIGREPGKLKGKIKVTAFMGKDASLCDVVDGAGFDRDDQVKLAD